jgi:hypothetical protein
VVKYDDLHQAAADLLFRTTQAQVPTAALLVNTLPCLIMPALLPAAAIQFQGKLDTLKQLIDSKPLLKDVVAADKAANVATVGSEAPGLPFAQHVGRTTCFPAAWVHLELL